jgi:glutamate-1-semialdehyde 2,1-aminomutase
MVDKTIAIIQARLTSKRFPNKIFQKLEKKTLIEFLLKRLRKSKKINQIVLAIPNNPENIKIKKIIKNVDFFFGNEEDVLDRYYKAAKKFGATVVIRICGDCPFVDPKIVDKLLNIFETKNFDYVSNTLKPTFPDGLDVEVFSFSALEKAWNRAKIKSDREHVTQYIIKNKKFKKYNYFYKKDLSKIRLTIDEMVDLQQIRTIYSCLENKNNFSVDDIYKLYMKNKKIFNINSSIPRNEGMNLNNGQKMWKRAKNIIPGGNMMLSKRPEMFAPDLWPTYYNKAKGCYVWDLDNKKYLDMSLMSVGTNILGYSNSKINNAVISAINKSNMSTLNCLEEIYLSEKLIDMHKHFEMVRFARTGGEANAIAVRLARAASGKDKIAICGYHGWHDWYLSANLNSQEKEDKLKDHHLSGLSTKGVPKSLKNTIYPFRFNDYASLEKICSNNNIGVIKMEIFRNISPKDNFLEKVRNLATKKKIVLIFDECTSGFRESFGGLHLKFKVFPDMCILGKALGNGFPITAVLGKREIMEHAQTSFISSTFWTERSGFVAAIKTLEIMEKIESWKIITKQGKKIKDIIKKMASKNSLDINIFGLDACPSYVLKLKKWQEYKTFITQELLKHKILGANTTYLSVNHNDKILNIYANKLDRIFQVIREIEDSGKDIDKFLEGPVSHSGFRRLN